MSKEEVQKKEEEMDEVAEELENMEKTIFGKWEDWKTISKERSYSVKKFHKKSVSDKLCALKLILIEFLSLTIFSNNYFLAILIYNLHSQKYIINITLGINKW